MARDLSEFLTSLQDAAKTDASLRERFPDISGNLKEILAVLKRQEGARKGPDLNKAADAHQSLAAYIAEAVQATREQEARSQAIHDMVAARLPQITDAQMQAYQAQRQAYDDHQRELKAQTQAVTKAMQAQVRAIEKEAKKQTQAIEREANSQIAAIDAEIEALKHREVDDAAKAAQYMLPEGIAAAKPEGKNTIASLLLEGFSAAYDAQQKEQAAAFEAMAVGSKEAIREEAEARKAAIQEEAAARVEAVREELEARKEAIKDEMDRRAEELNIVKPESPVKQLASQRAQLERDVARLPGIEKVSPAELRAGEKKAAEYREPPAQPIDLGPKATKAPAAQKAPTPQMPQAPTSRAPSAPKAPVPQAPQAPAPKPAPLPKGKPLAPAGGLPGGIGGPAMAGIAKAALRAAGPSVLAAQALKDVNDAIPVVTKGIGAIADGSRVLGPLLLSVGAEIAGYIYEGLANVVEAIEGLFHTTRKERLEKSGQLEAERVEAGRKAEEQHTAAQESIRGQIGIGQGSLDVMLPLQRIEQTLTTPAEAAGQAGPATAAARSEADIQSMRAALEEMIRIQSQNLQASRDRGVGTTPVLMQSPSLSMFPV